MTTLNPLTLIAKKKSNSIKGKVITFFIKQNKSSAVRKGGGSEGAGRPGRKNLGVNQIYKTIIIFDLLQEKVELGGANCKFVPGAVFSSHVYKSMQILCEYMN